MNYENMPCPVCGSHFHAGDDIVVCPDCGTPCHRECWRETGHCINESKHGEGFAFAAAPKEAEVNAAPAEDSFDDMIACHICGSENPVTSRNCNHCGALLNQNKQSENVCPVCKEEVEQGEILCPNCGASLLPASVTPLRAYNPFDGTDPNEKLGENYVGEITSYLKIHTAKYVKKFHNIEDKGKINFNWSAFFFGPLWFLFRKMFLYGLILLMTLSCISLILIPSAEKTLVTFNEAAPEISKYNSIINGTTDKTAESKNEMSVEEATKKSIELQTKLYKEIFSILKKPMAIYLAILMVINLLCGFKADSLYYSKIKKDLEAVKEEVPDNRVRAMLISRRGGVSILNVVCGFFVYDLFQSIAVTIADYISNMF